MSELILYDTKQNISLQPAVAAKESLTAQSEGVCQASAQDDADLLVLENTFKKCSKP